MVGPTNRRPRNNIGFSSFQHISTHGPYLWCSYSQWKRRPINLVLLVCDHLIRLPNSPAGSISFIECHLRLTDKMSPTGLEPASHGLEIRCLIPLGYEDSLVKNYLLFILFICLIVIRWVAFPWIILPKGFEPPTPRFVAACSIPLSYGSRNSWGLRI